MFYLVKKFYLKGCVLDIALVNRYIVATDNLYNIYYIHRDNFEIKKYYTLLKTDNKLHKYAKSSILSNNGYLTLGPIKTKKSVVFSFYPELKQKSIFEWHDGDIEVCSFSENENYFATGGNDGKVFIYDMNEVDRLVSLPNSPDFISSLTFSKNLELISSSAFSGITTIFDIDRSSIYSDFETKGVVEDSSFFENGTKLLLVTRDGYSTIYNTETKIIESEKKLFSNWPTKCSVFKTQKYALISTRDNLIYILRLSDNEIIDLIHLENMEISCIKIVDNYLYVGFCNGEILVIDLEFGIKELEIELKLKNYFKAKKIIDKNRFLVISTIANKFDEDWEVVFDKFISLISEGRGFEAVKLVKPFLFDKIKKAKVDSILNEKTGIENFRGAIKSEDYVKAFELVEKHPFLETIPLYETLNNYWQDLMTKTKNLLLNSKSLQDRIRAKRILEPYLKLQSKEKIIKSLFAQSDLYPKAEELLKQKNFKGYFELCEKCEFLKSSKSYQKVLNLSKKLYDDLIEKKKIEDFDGVIQIASILVEFTPYKKVAQNELQEIYMMKSFIAYLKNNEFKRAFVILNSYPQFKYISIYEKFDKKIKKVFKKAKNSAFKGDAPKTFKRLKPFFEFEYFQAKIASIMKVAYINEMKNLLKTRSLKRVDDYLLNYVSRFGKDNEIVAICKKFKVQSYLNKIDESGFSEDNYKIIGFLTSIEN